jgi:hypothetical protein
MQMEVKEFLWAGVAGISAFQVVDASNNKLGYDNYKFTTQAQGDVVLTSHVVAVLQSLKAELTDAPSTLSASDLQAIIDANT